MGFPAASGSGTVGGIGVVIRHLFVMAAWLVSCVGATAHPEAAAARVLFLRGNLDEAREAFAKLVDRPETTTIAVIGLSRIDEAQGRAPAALLTIRDALKLRESDALLARAAELAYALGDRPLAQEFADRALRLNDDNFPARWIRSRLLLDAGRYDDADAERRWFIRAYSARNRAGRDIRDPDDLMFVARAGAENAALHRLSDQYKFILNELLADILKIDPNYWPAECFAGQLLLSKSNKGQALLAFDKALAINPRAVEAMVGKGRLALEQFDLTAADAFADRALEINPDNAEARLLKADVAWSAGDVATALENLERLQPTGREDVLARLSVARRDAAIRPANPKPARYHHQRGKWLDDRRAYREARADYEKAVEFGGSLTPARTDLGLLAFRMGEEDEARRLLREAFRDDPFQVRVSNCLKVLKHLESYQTITTKHFVVRFDPKTDAALGRLVAAMLEDEYASLAEQFRHRPAGPFVVEVFSSHEMFSGRIVAAPDLYTVGATTGRVMAIAAPRATGVPRPYNWARVIRHELTHIFNLDQSNYLVGHWLTEGLAVNRERTARPAEWTRLLAAAAHDGELFSIAELDRGFTKPRDPGEWTLAYAQAQLAVNFVQSRYGSDSPVRLMEAYRDGAATRFALEAVCGEPLDTIERGYARFVRDDIAGQSVRRPAPVFSLARIEQALEREPDSPAWNARAAEQYLRRKRGRDAREHAEVALAREPGNGLASRVLAQLCAEAGDTDRARELLANATAGDPPDMEALRALVRLLILTERHEEAVVQAERGARLEPAEPAWHADLARAARLAGDHDKAIRAQMTFLKHEPDELDPRRELARTLFDLERYREAEAVAREAIEIDPNDEVAADLLVKSLLRQSKPEEANRWRSLLGRPAP